MRTPNRSVLFTALLALTVALLAGCATSGSRYSHQGQGGYRSDYDGYARCQSCGVVERIERVYGERSSNGAGAVLGGILGGVLGNQVGSGSGRAAATMAGAVAGVAAGTAIEKNNNAAPWFDLFLRMDDGRRIVVSQRDLDGIHQGAYVRVSNGRAWLN